MTVSIPDTLRRPETIALVLAAASAAVVSTAWGFELIGGFVPCKLCLEQRLPYYWGAGLGLAAFLIGRLGAPRLVVRLILVAMAGLFLWGLSVGAYQAGAEWGWWQGPTDCGATRGADIPAAAGDLMASLAKVKIVDCSKAQIRILGLSFAGWNVPTSLALAAVALFGAVVRRRAAP